MFIRLGQILVIEDMTNILKALVQYLVPKRERRDNTRREGRGEEREEGRERREGRKDGGRRGREREGGRGMLIVRHLIGS